MNLTLNTALAFAIGLVQLILALFKSIYHVFFSYKRSISDEIVLITEAGSGLGRHLAHQFARQGSTVIVWDANKKDAEDVARDIKELGGKATAYGVSLIDRGAIYASAAAAFRDIGSVSVLVINTPFQEGKKTLDNSDDSIEHNFHINMLAPFHLLKAFLPSILQQNRGHIVTISSTAAFVGVAGYPDLSAIRCASFGMNESLRLEFQKLKMTGIKTTYVAASPSSKAEPQNGSRSLFSRLLIHEEPEALASSIVDAVRSGSPYVIRPYLAYAVAPIKTILPTPVFDKALDVFGFLDTASGFKHTQSTEQ